MTSPCHLLYVPSSIAFMNVSIKMIGNFHKKNFVQDEYFGMLFFVWAFKDLLQCCKNSNSKSEKGKVKPELKKQHYFSTFAAFAESTVSKMVREKMTCLLCRGLISFKGRNQARFLDHIFFS